MSQGQGKSIWTNIKDVLKNLQTYVASPIKTLKNSFDFIGNLAQFIDEAPTPINRFIMLIGRIAQNSHVKIALGFISPILGTIDLICDINAINALREEGRERLLLRLLAISDDNLKLFEESLFNEEDSSYDAEGVKILNIIRTQKARAELQELNAALGQFITNNNAHASFAAVKKYLAQKGNEEIKAQFDAAAKLMDQLDEEAVNLVFAISNMQFTEDGAQDRKDFRIKCNKKYIKAYKTAAVVAFAWLTTTYGVIKYALQLSALAKPAVPYLTFGSLVFSYLSVITLTIFTVIELGALIKDFVDMYNGNDDKGREFRREILKNLKQPNSDENWKNVRFKDMWWSTLKFFVTEGFALNMFSIAGTSVAILLSILLLAGVVSAPVSGMTVAAIFAILAASKIVDLVVRKIVDKYSMKVPPTNDPVKHEEKSVVVSEETEEKRKELTARKEAKHDAKNSTAPTQTRPGSNYGPPSDENE